MVTYQDLMGLGMVNLGPFNGSDDHSNTTQFLNQFIEESVVNTCEAQYRSPTHKWSAFNDFYGIRDQSSSMVENWHQDGSGNCFILGVWATHKPTEVIEIKDQRIVDPLRSQTDPLRDVCVFYPTIYSARPGDLILFRNDKFKHRVPMMSKTAASKRHFLRIYLYGDS